jgi:hypothetical protein
LETVPVRILEYFPAPKAVFSLELEADHTIVYIDTTLDSPAAIIML